MLNFSLVLQRLDAHKEKLKRANNAALFELSKFVKENLANSVFQEKIKKSAEKQNVPSWQGLFGATQKLSNNSKDYRILAVDGSQIWPDRQTGSADIALVQIAGVLFDYGASKSATHYFSEVELLFAQDFKGVSFDKNLVEQARDLLELQCAVKWAQESALAPIILMDGSLNFLRERFAAQEKLAYKNFGERFFKSLAALEEQKITTVFYTSRPASKKFVELLRMEHCVAPYFDKTDCSGACGQIACQKLSQIDDALLFGELLDSQEASQFFTTADTETSVQSCFLNTARQGKVFGGEIAKLELVNEQDSFLEQIFDQAVKGQGYPIALAMAHHCAMINYAEQKKFEQLCTQFVDKKNQDYSKKLLCKKYVYF